MGSFKQNAVNYCSVDKVKKKSLSIVMLIYLENVHYTFMQYPI